MALELASYFWYTWTRAAICSRCSCWPRVVSMLRRFLQGARPTHERPETALCAARGPPRRRVWSRGPQNAFWQKMCICAKRRRRSTETVRGPLTEAEGNICRVFAMANLNARITGSALGSSPKSPSSSGRRLAWRPRRRRDLLRSRTERGRGPVPSGKLAQMISDSFSAPDKSHGPKYVPRESSAGLSPTSWPRGAHATVAAARGN